MKEEPTLREEDKNVQHFISILIVPSSLKLSLYSSTMADIPSKKGTSPPREINISPLYILSNSIFFSPDGKEIESKINMALCIAENQDVMREWSKVHGGGNKVKCIFDGTVIPRKMNSCKMSRIDKFQFEKDMMEVLKKDMEDMERRDEKDRKQMLRRMERLKWMKELKGNKEWVTEMKKNITVYTNEKDIFNKKYTCELILKNTFHLTCWKEIYATVGHVHCYVHWSVSRPTILNMAGTKKGVHLYDSSVPQDKKNTTIDSLKATLEQMYRDEVDKIMKNTTFESNPFDDDAGPLKEEYACQDIIRDPKLLSEWYGIHDGKYRVKYSGRSFGGCYMRREW